MADTFLVLRTNDTSPQLFFHDGQNISPTGLGALPAAALEDLTIFGAARTNVKHNNRVFTLLDMIFVIQDSKIYVSTDEGATFTLDFTFTGGAANTYECQVVGPVPVMVSGALKLVGFYLSGTDIFVFEYDVAGDAWSDADTAVNATTGTAGATVPVVWNGLVYARVGDVFVAYDPVSTGTVLLTTGGLSGYGGDQMFAWNGDLWAGPVHDGGSGSGLAKLQGSTFDVNVGGVILSAVDFVSTTSKSGIFIDPNTGNLIVMQVDTGLSIYRVTPGLAVTDITGTVAGVGLAALGAFGVNTRFWPHITRSPGGNYTVNVYASRGPDTTDPVERFTWVSDAANFTELGIVGGSGDMAFPYSIAGGDNYGFFAGEKRTMQTAQTGTSTGIKITCEAYQQGGTTLSVRGHYDNLDGVSNDLTLDPMTLGNPTGTGGLSVSGVNPGAQVDGVPANRTAIQFDWDQVTDGFVTGNNFNFQLEAL